MFRLKEKLLTKDNILLFYKIMNCDIKNIYYLILSFIKYVGTF